MSKNNRRFKGIIAFLIVCIVQTALPAAIVLTGVSATTPTPARAPVITPANANSLKQVERFGEGFPGGGIAYSPDGNILAVSNSLGIWLYDAKSNFETPIKLLDQDDWIHSVAFSPNGEFLADAGNKSIQLWNVDTGSKSTSFQGDTLAAFSPDGRYLATRSLITPEDGDWPTAAVRLYDVVSGELLSTLVADHWSTRMTDLAFSPDGKLIAAIWSASDYGTGCYEDAVQRLQVWQVKDALRQSTIKPQDMLYAIEVNSFHLAFSPDSRELVYGDSKTGIAIWNTLTHTVDEVWGEHGDVFTGGAFSPSGKFLAVSIRKMKDELGSDNVDLYDAQTGKKLRSVSNQSLSSLIFGKDNRTVVGLYGDTLRLIDTQTGETRNFPKGQPPLILSDNGSVAVQQTDSGVSVVDLGTAKQHEVPISLPVQKLLLTTDGRLLATLDERGQVRIWELATGTLQATLAGNLSVSDPALQDMTFNAEGTILATQSLGENSENQFRLWNTKTGEQIGTIPGGNEHPRLLFSPRGDIVAVYEGYYNASDITLWHIDANSTYKLKAIGAGSPIAFNPQGTGIVYRKVDQVYFSDLATGQEFALVTLQEANIATISGAFSPDG